jgi:hypothetical protein
MEKRYQVFVSSTYEDLREERQEVMQALLELDCIPAGMELFPAADEDQWTLIKSVVDHCDYHVLVIAGRYGSLGSSGKSYTQMEHEYAISKGIPSIAFIHANPAAIPMGKTESDQEGRKHLADFIEIAKGKTCRFWNNSAELGSLVSRSLTQLIKVKPGVGWVRADQVPEKAALEILRLQTHLQELEAALQPQEMSDLAQGDDRIQFTFNCGAGEQGWKVTESMSWNQVIAALAPYLRTPSSDLDLRKRFNLNLARNLPQSEPSLPQGFDPKEVSFSVYESDFTQMMLQLQALRLIEKDTQSKDGEVRWKLGAYGERKMIEMLAIRRPQKAAAAEN